jgi:hypothetical protein
MPSPLKKQLHAVGVTLRRLERQLLALAPAIAAAVKANTPSAASAARAVRRKLRLSPARRRALKLQGSYLGYMRQLKPTQKAKVKAVKAKKGMRAAIATARGMVERGR